MICVFLSTTSDFVSRVIRWNTRCDYSHAGFLDTDTGKTFSAMFSGGVAFRDLKDLRPTSVLKLWFPGTEEAYRWALTQEGKPYDWQAITGMAFDRDWRSDSAWFCSELVAASFHQVGRPLFSPLTTTFRITPRDLLLPDNLTLLQESDHA